ncbi:MAG: hypothetical protein H0U73_01355 [Tatlockia sp.]|nr:hypothetical protein [Tatlockia sp.]
MSNFLASSLRAEPSIQTKMVEGSRYAAGIESILHSHQYIQNNKAPLYWRLSPYYLPQLTDSSCSLASATMIVNAVLSQQKLMTKRALATQDEVLNRVNDNDWRNAVKQGGDGVTLVQLKTFLAKALEAYGIFNFELDLVQLKGNSKRDEFSLRNLLMESENTGTTFIIANFNQKFFTGAMSVGHFSPIGAYDSKTKRALILDTDRELYEPYWVPEKLLLDSMATFDNDAGLYRGYLVLRLLPTKV